jgi:MinD superfamily P-loop ATPase
MTLPKATPLGAVFSRESFGKKLVKLFKSELQVGDPAFDDVVYVIAKDKETASRFLADPSARAEVARLVGDGATIEIDGANVVITVTQPGAVVVSDTASIERLVRVILGFA